MSEKEHVKAVKTAGMVSGLEKWVDEIVNKKQPLQLPTNARKWIADNSWWIILIGGVLSLWSTWGFWQAGHYIDGLNRWANEVSKMYGGNTYATELGPMWYVALAGIALEGILMLLAVSKLKNHQKSGWNLVFYSTLVSLVVGVAYLLVPAYGFGSLIGTLIGTAFSWFFLFQVRSRFIN